MVAFTGTSPGVDRHGGTASAHTGRITGSGQGEWGVMRLGWMGFLKMASKRGNWQRGFSTRQFEFDFQGLC